MLVKDSAPGMKCVEVTSHKIPDSGGKIRVELVFSPTVPDPHFNPDHRPYNMADDIAAPPQIPDDINDLANLRRHHTISTARRPPRPQARIPISEAENEDEVVGNDWVGGVGAVGEGKGLHRQSSLPSKYNNRGYRQPGTSSGTMTPSRVAAVNSLSAIAAEHGLEGEEDDMWGQIRDWRGDDLPASALGDPVSLSTASAGSQIGHGQHARTLSQSSHSSSISPMLSEEAGAPLPSTSGAGVRRHQSLTYGAHGHPPPGSAARSLMRAATIGKTGRASALNARGEAAAQDSTYLPEGADDIVDDDAVVSPASNSTGHGSAGHGRPWGAQSSSVTPNSSPWGQSAQPNIQQYPTSDDALDHVQRSLAGLEIDNGASSNSGQLYGNYYSAYSNQGLAQPPTNPNHTRKLSPPPNYPPRFRSPSPNSATELPYASAVASAALKATSILQPNNPVSQVTNSSGRSPIHKLSLVTNLTQGQGSGQQGGPVSAAAYVPPTGGGLPLGEELGRDGRDSNADGGPTPVGPGGRDRDKPLTATGTAWDQKERIAGSRGVNDMQGNSMANPASFFTNPAMFASFDPMLQQQIITAMQQQQGGMASLQAFGGLPGMSSGPFGQAGLPGLQMLQQQMLQQQMLQQQQLYAHPPHGQYAQAQPHGIPARSPPLNGSNVAPASWNATANVNVSDVGSDNPLASPVDIQELSAKKGYNPATFDTKPANARFFVIKSYTEDDVHKSLKYEIWSSTEPGNKRLDKAFKDNNGRGPIYLFFSVNASGHFCGVAEMLTPVDYTRSSTVWAQDKWKGVIKVKWIFVRDVPNSVLRHIRLLNTQEQKPVTNSRDTQELLPEAGHEMLRIFLTHPARTSLLQDFAFYELQSMQRTPGSGNQSPPQQQAPQQTTPSRQGSLPVYNSQSQQQQSSRQGMTSPPPRQDSAQGYASPPRI